MKTLQNDLTTIEQSKRLLELGVPKNSANHYYGLDSKSHFIDGTIPYSLLWRIGCTPCWSVDRLIEIYISCIEHYIGDERLTFGQDTVRLGMIDYIIAAIEVGCDDGNMDFSKLED